MPASKTRRTFARAFLFHQVDELVIHRCVSDRVHETVSPGAQRFLGKAELWRVNKGSESDRMGFLDDGRHDRDWHRGDRRPSGMRLIGVDQLDPVHSCRMQRTNVRTRLVRGRRQEAGKPRLGGMTSRYGNRPAYAEEAWHWRGVFVCLPAKADEFLDVRVGVRRRKDSGESPREHLRQIPRLFPSDVLTWSGRARH